MAPLFEKRDLRFRRFKDKDPGLSFARYAAERMHGELLQRHPYNPKGAISAALEPSFWEAGRNKAEKLLAAMAPARGDKVLEYGCGSLRIGAHFIRYLDAHCFMGLDVISGFYEMGVAALGPQMMAEKAPRLAVIDEAGIAQGEAFAPDFVYSNVVCVHVHPDEVDAYFGNLARLAHKPGARLIFNARLTDTPTRFEFDGWSWPLDFYKDHLPGFDMIRAATGTMQVQNDIQTMPVDFEFRRPVPAR
jgi:cyclopropane fatty-acyl-phospholipid synthase-like methyltransferase